MEDQPCLSQQLLTLGPTVVMRKCPSTLRMVLSLSRQLPSPSLECEFHACELIRCSP